MYVDIVISNAFNLNKKNYFLSFFQAVHTTFLTWKLTVAVRVILIILPNWFFLHNLFFLYWSFLTGSFVSILESYQILCRLTVFISCFFSISQKFKFAVYISNFILFLSICRCTASVNHFVKSFIPRWIRVLSAKHDYVYSVVSLFISDILCIKNRTGLITLTLRLCHLF